MRQYLLCNLVLLCGEEVEVVVEKALAEGTLAQKFVWGLAAQFENKLPVRASQTAGCD